MLLPRHVRQTALAKLTADPSKPVSQNKLFYKGSSRVYPVHVIDLDLLVYNRHNGRLETEMLTWQHEHSVGDEEYDEEFHNQIESFLWNTNTSRNRRTLRDLEHKGQQRPGIVTLDGVIIDGNRRAMLLRRLENQTNQKRFLEAVILPDAYDENEKEIVRLETQYQLGEDAILDYGPLEKYLHVKRLHESLGISEAEIGQLMGETTTAVTRLLEIMRLMDEYLAHIGCDGLYNMLKEDDGGGTKEGMFVDLHSDVRRFEGGSGQVQWTFDPIVDILDLKTIQFDHIRYGSDFTGTNKTYRAISHDGGGKKSFFAHQNVWAAFANAHRQHVDPVTKALASLDDYLETDPNYDSRINAARARDLDWRRDVRAPIKRNFGISNEALDEIVDEIIEPNRLLSRALGALRRVDLESPGLTSNVKNKEIILEITRLTFNMKKAIERSQRDNGTSPRGNEGRE